MKKVFIIFALTLIGIGLLVMVGSMLVLGMDISKLQIALFT